MQPPSSPSAPPSAPHAPWPTRPQRAPARSPLSRPSRPPDPPAYLSRSSITDRLLYRWERLTHTQQQAAWGMVEQMRRVVAQERTRGRRRSVVLGIMVLLILALDALLYYLLASARPL